MTTYAYFGGHGIDRGRQTQHAVPVLARARRGIWKCLCRLSGEEAQEDTGCNSRTDYTGDVGAHSVHQQIVLRIVFQAEVIGNTCTHRHGAHAGIADERIDFLTLGKEDIEKLDKEHATGAGNDKGHKPEEEDAHSFDGEKLRSLSGGAHGHTEQNCHDVSHGVAGSLGQACGDTAFAQQVTEEEHSQQGKCGGHNEAGQKHSNDREDNLLVLRDGTRGLHADEALFLGGE